VQSRAHEHEPGWVDCHEIAVAAGPGQPSGREAAGRPGPDCPASDVLASQVLFLAQDAGVTGVEQAELGADLGAVQRAGYQLRVATIASAADLGSVTELWRRPRAYARFLGVELSLVDRGPLLVVMPDGFGSYRLVSARRPSPSCPRWAKSEPAGWEPRRSRRSSVSPRSRGIPCPPRPPRRRRAPSRATRSRGSCSRQAPR
jgi:hypothetical protein